MAAHKRALCWLGGQSGNGRLVTYVTSFRSLCERPSRLWRSRSRLVASLISVLVAGCRESFFLFLAMYLCMRSFFASEFCKTVYLSLWKEIYCCWWFQISSREMLSSKRLLKESL